MEIPAKIEDKIVDPTNYIDGVFYFSNTSKDEFKALWNNVEYSFPPMSCVPLLIPDHTAVQIQEIRKRFAYRWAEAQWFQGKEYKSMVKIGGVKPSARDDKHLEPLIQMCLTPLPLRPLKSEVIKMKVKLTGKSKPVDDGFDAKATFKDTTDEEVNG